MNGYNMLFQDWHCFSEHFLDPHMTSPFSWEQFSNLENDKFSGETLLFVEVRARRDGCRIYD
jgi:hypothetical protein